MIGFRLFPNPNFDAAARKKWDATRFYTEPDYYQNPELVRPYRVGVGPPRIGELPLCVLPHSYELPG